MEYNPFAVNAGSVQASDLAVLRNVAEGWYVEYKRTLPSATSAAKSISSFANTYGGWLFYGIEEEVAGGRKTGRAGAFPGIPEDQLATMASSIVSSVRQLRPTPFFEIHTIKGVDGDANLAPNRGIIMVWIPEGSDAPYIHPDGRIFAGLRISQIRQQKLIVRLLTHFTLEPFEGKTGLPKF